MSKLGKSNDIEVSEENLNTGNFLEILINP